MPRRYRPHQFDYHTIHQSQPVHDEEVLTDAPSERGSEQRSVVALQRQIGNSGVQRLLRTGGIHEIAGADMVHRKGCGCAACASSADRIQRVANPQIQRFWGDDEEESDSGGSVWDSVTEAAGSAWDSASGAVSDAASGVSDAAGSAWDSASGAAGDAASSVGEAAGSIWDSASEAAGNAWDTVTDIAGNVGDAASSAWGAVSGAAESAWGAVSEAAGEAGNMFGGLFGDEESEEGEPEEEDEGPTSGSVEAIKGSKVGMGGGCDLPYGTPHPRFFRPSARQRMAQRKAQRKATGPTRPYKINANITLVEHTGNEAPVESSFMAFDMPTSFKAGAYFDFGSVTEPGGIRIPGSAFGYSAPTITVDNIKWTIDPPSASIGITARIHVWVNWAIRSNDKQDINTGNEDSVTKNNWDYVIRDLSPSTGEGQPARSLYYSSTVTVQHEVYHANEYIASAKGQIPAMSSWVAGQTIDLPEDKSDAHVSVVGGKVSSLMSQVRDKVEAAVKARYDGGGENRAYADGKGEYNGIIANIEKRAKAKGWPKNLVNP
ncbi:MAG TPA: hypothetical protein VER79_03035 [Candidatus Limnocylindrales bacterium]|nr:hypothetical protein [Candidatus Limnocylindrales bacterium]